MQTRSENFNILVVEDNPSDQFLLEEMLSSSRLRIREIYAASTIAQAREILSAREVNFVLLDLSLPDSFGIDTLTTIRDLTPRIPIIILTGLSDSETALQALKQNAQDYLVKGEFNTNLLTKSIEYSIARKKNEDTIVASEEKYRQMFYRNPFPMWINDEESLKILEVNDAAIQKYGYGREEFLKLSLNDLRIPQALTDDTPADSAPEKLWKHRKKNGDLMIVEFTYYPINYFGRTALQAQVNDITENIRLENELSFQKKQMIQAVLHAQEQERKIIGRELHDNINQILTAVKLNLSVALDQKDNRGLINKCQKSVETVMDEIRKLSKELILPGNLKELGLASSIQDLLKQTLHLTGIKWKLMSENVEEHTISEEQKLTTYRIVQEQLNNILKHSKASTVTIHLAVKQSKVNLKIVDDGKGFDTTQQRKGVGLTNILNRAELFNGKAVIDSTPGKGCRLEVQLNTKLSLPAKNAVAESVLTH